MQDTEKTPQDTTGSSTRPLTFAFPFRDAKGKTIIDEHLFHDWLMNEPGGNFAASSSGMWHGGIHVSADGSGPMLDLKHGVRCLADGEVIAYRLDRASPVSRIAASGAQPALNVPYSTGFALVRHALEYPAGNRLFFFSLYMHLQGFADYECEPSQPRPGYWSTQVEVTDHARDRPNPASNERPPAPEHAGLRVRASKQHGTILCILPRGARATIGRRDGDWGQVTSVEGPPPWPPQEGRFVGPDAAIGGWIFLGSEHGGPVVREVMPDPAFARVVIPPHPVKIGAGDLIGHLGPYWRTADPAQPNRMVHIEVFCDSTLPACIAASRTAAEADYHSERPILRIDRGVKLYAGPSVKQEGADAPRTGVVQVYSQSVLDALPADCRAPVDDDPFNHGKGEPWWKITSADSRYADITGWVRNRQTPAGRVTRESPGHWIDFETFTDSDAGNPTLFGTTDAWLDYVLDADKPALADVGRLKPLAAGIYRAISPARNEKEAADELLSHGANRWLRFRASRLIPRHRSEWASEESYRELFARLLTRTAPSPYHDAEMERIGRLAWWNEVQGKVSQPFPASPDVFHIHPIGLVGNFTTARKRRDYDLGRLSSQYETGGRGPSTVSGGQGDPGGVSYGSYQMTSKTRQRDGSFVIGGTVQKFVSSSDFPWVTAFAGLTPGTPPFSQQWQTTVFENKEKFTAVEHEFIRKTHFDVQIDYVISHAGVDLRYHSHAINDVVWSVSVQNGPSTDVISTAIKNHGAEATETREYDQALIDAIFAERGKKNFQGQMIRFIHSSAEQQHGIEGRYMSERKKAQEELKSELDY